MRLILLAAAFSAASVPAYAQSASASAPTPASASAAATKYTTSDTEIGTLLDDPAAKAIIEKNIPGFTTNDQVDMARGMTLKAVQQYSPDAVTDAKLAAIDTEFAKLKK